MRQVVVLSGKGGTGKTTVAAALAHLASRDGGAVLVDADVDAPNLGILLQPQIEATIPFTGGSRARVIAERCVGCGRCFDVCRFDAVTWRDGVYRIQTLSCEGCAACYYQCPEEAIAMDPCQAGEWYRSSTRFGPLFHAQLFPGQENSGKLVSTVRQQAIIAAAAAEAPWVIIDGAPGIGCPVIAAATGADLAVLVTEPTMSGLHDLQRVADLMQHLRVPPIVCLNKADLSTELADRIIAYCRQEAIPTAAHIPYDGHVQQAMQTAKAITELPDTPANHAMRVLWATMVEVTRATG
ncbi:MAG TPA: P-loop NTPase [Chloroflexi bacterium]|jgi:MinD superfamily P-loop ATPase|nr:P-loop NTPase [Chloroflexota bacterium]